MKSPFNFQSGDTPVRLIADTLCLLLIGALCWLGWGLTNG